MGLRDCDGEVVKEPLAEAHAELEGLNVVLCVAVEQTVPLTLVVGERLIVGLVVKLVDAVGLRDCDGDVV